MATQGFKDMSWNVRELAAESAVIFEMPALKSLTFFGLFRQDLSHHLLFFHVEASKEE